jgi:hypothetical protein
MKLISGSSALVSTINDWYSLDIGFSCTRQSSGVYKTDTAKTTSMKEKRGRWF